MEIRELENTYIQDLETLGDWFLQYEYLVRLGSDMGRLPEEEKTEETRIPGCQTGTWMTLRAEDGKVYAAADSNALLMRGVLAILTELVNGRTAEELEDWVPRFVDDTAIGSQLSSDRSRGFSAAAERIRSFAREAGGNGS